MVSDKLFKNVFSTLIVSALLICLQIEIAGQCGGTYFKRLSTNLVPMNGYISTSDDLTGDGIPDLIAFGFEVQQNTATKLIILPANGAGGFGSPMVINQPPSLAFFTYLTGNFDNDNFRDIVALFNSNPQTVLVYKNNGNGTFTPQILTPSPGGGMVHLIDINNDGKGDLISTNGVSASYYGLGNGDGTFASPVQFANGNNPVPGDFNTDGKIDFINGNALLINLGGGIFSPVNNALTLGTNEYISDIKDFNGDGKPDVLTVTHSTTVKISLLLNTGSNSFSRTDYVIATDQQNGNWNGTVYTGNFSGNNSPDVLFSVPFLNKTLVFTNDGTGNLSAQTFDYRFNGNFAGDYDSDGKTDLVNVSQGNNLAVSHKLFDEISATIQKNVCNPPGQTRIVDYDRSGSTDYSYWTPANGLWAYQPSTSTSGNGITQTFIWGLGSLGDIPTPGDFDGDGITDYAIYRNSTGAWWVRRSSDLNAFTIQFGITGDKPVVGDYDGDSISDIAVWRPADGNWYILFMGTQSYTIVHWGQDGDKPVPEDYDGDGKIDLAVFRPSNGAWYYLRSSDLNFVALQFGVSGDKPVAADYDGDGKADIAVYRESESVLHILRSYNLAYAARQYGVFQDIPQTGDFDGDFVFDFAVYRPFAQRWYSTNSPYQVNFGASNIIPTSSILKIE